MTRAVGASALVRLLGGWRSGSGTAYRDLAAALRLLVLDGRLPLDVALPGE
ncbi:MAG: PLP-dependent aminotransferase family protein, partial [Actinomycetota bacterium]|nr:PLP-dependent aminotransferase family protein [Actinomycetota bacterium]